MAGKIAKMNKRIERLEGIAMGAGFLLQKLRAKYGDDFGAGMTDTNQKLREALQAISHIDDTTNHSVDASAALDRIGQIARQALALPTTDENLYLDGVNVEHNNAPAVPQGWVEQMLTDARCVFDAGGPETPQETRDVIEYVASWIAAYRDKFAATPVPAPAPASGILDRARWGEKEVNLMRLAEAADKAVASMTVPAPETGSESKIVIDVGPGGSGGGPAEAAPAPQNEDQAAMWEYALYCARQVDAAAAESARLRAELQERIDAPTQEPVTDGQMLDWLAANPAASIEECSGVWFFSGKPFPSLRKAIICALRAKEPK